MKYNVGDKVRIKSIDWYNKNINNNGIIICGSESFTHLMSHFCDKVVTIITIQDNCYRILEDDGDWYWTDEMIECKVEEEIKPKFKVGDKVKWHNHICNITSIDTYENTYIYLIMYDDYREDATFVKWAPESELIFEDDKEIKNWADTSIPDGPYTVTYDSPSMNDSMNKNNIHNEIILPKGYIFKDDNGNVINATKIVLEKKKKYPKTYEECCRIFQYNENLKVYPPFSADIPNYDALHLFGLLEALRKLLICRDAYWKIAGDEMGLGKPWEPDWKNSEERRYCIVNIEGDINLPEKILTKWILKVTNKILVFPTEEMRDAFYEAFREEIEICKELL